MSYQLIKDSLNRLVDFVENESYKGWDPFDGLNSKLFLATPLKKNKYFRLVWLQLFKRNPINLRSITGIKKEYNPKGIGLLLSSYCNLYQVSGSKEILSKAKYLKNILTSHISQGYSGACWGYNFDWQAKAFFQPKFTPTVVATTFNAHALLDLYNINNENDLLNIARSSCDFILKDLNRTYDHISSYALSYSPLDNTQIFNASLLGAKLLARVSSYTNEKNLMEEAKKIVTFCVDHQNSDGSWAYGTLPHHQWIDSFHTGYNLECLFEYTKYSLDQAITNNIRMGFDYYIKNFFTNEGISKYYNNKLYPVDIHSPSQFIITLFHLDLLKEYRDMAEKVLVWTIQNMQSKKGYFYYRKNSILINKIPYMRWSQAWMMLALSYYLKYFNNES